MSIETDVGTQTIEVSRDKKYIYIYMEKIWTHWALATNCSSEVLVFKTSSWPTIVGIYSQSNPPLHEENTDNASHIIFF
jgi:hypothetical protein